MKILTPITSSSDIETLEPSIYGTEFFCGYSTMWWETRFRSDSSADSPISIPLNNRNGKNANFHSLSELQNAVHTAEEKQTNLFLVLNAKHYPSYVYSELKKYIDEVVSAGIRKMIVCDIGMIHFLNTHYPEIKVSVSCLNQVTNSMAVRFYAQFKNVERIVFPRHMHIDEIHAIASSMPEMQFEYFIFSNRCLYDDGYCRGIHEFTPICKDLYFSEFYSADGLPLSDTTMHQYRTGAAAFSEWTRNEIMVSEHQYCTASFACTACSLPVLMKEPNIVSVKISIRGHSIDERLRQVQMAREAISATESEPDLRAIQQKICSLYGKETLCKAGMSCMMK